MATEGIIDNLKTILVESISDSPVSFLAKNDIILGLTIIVLLFFVSKLVAYILKTRIKAITKKTKTELDDLILENIQDPIAYLLFLLGIIIGVQVMNLDPSYSNVVSNILSSFAVIIIGYTVMKVGDIIIEMWGAAFANRTSSTLDDDILPLIRKAFKVLIAAFIFIYILNSWGVNIGPFIASLGLAGVAIGFAVKDSLANIFGGISLILDQTFKVGDKVKIDSGEVGVVYDVGLRSTKIKTYDNDLIIIPNCKMATAKVYSYAQPSVKRKVSVKFGVAYGTDINKVKNLILKEVQSQKEKMEDPEPSVIFLEMGESSLNFKASYWVDHYGKVFSGELELNEKIYNALNKAKIEIPYPTRTVIAKRK